MLYRGHKIEKVNSGIYVYSDTKEAVRNNINRKCGQCGLNNTKEGHDGCLETLPGVMNACCGHGEANSAYVQFDNKVTISGKRALSSINKMKMMAKE